MVSGHDHLTTPGQNPPCQKPQDKKAQTKTPTQISLTKFQVRFYKHFIAFLKDVFMRLPHHILNFSTLTAW